MHSSKVQLLFIFLTCDLCRVVLADAEASFKHPVKSLEPQVSYGSVKSTSSLQLQVASNGRAEALNNPHITPSWHGDFDRKKPIHIRWAKYQNMCLTYDHKLGKTTA